MVAVPNSSGTKRLLQRAGPGRDSKAVGELVGRHRERLRKMVRVRLDCALRGRISSTSILDDVHHEVGRRLDEYDASGMSFFLWLREITGRRIEEIHRQHFGDRPEKATELRLYRGSLPEVTAGSMAAQLLGDRGANQSATRTHTMLLLQEALDALGPLDREILAAEF